MTFRKRHALRQSHQWMLSPRRITSAVTVAEVVAASAAFPDLLPALRRDYDFRDRATGPANATITYGYDELGRRTSTDISGTSSSVALDAAGRVTGDQRTTALTGIWTPIRIAGCVGRPYEMLLVG